MSDFQLAAALMATATAYGDYLGARAFHCHATHGRGVLIVMDGVDIADLPYVTPSDDPDMPPDVRRAVGEYNPQTEYLVALFEDGATACVHVKYPPPGGLRPIEAAHAPHLDTTH